MEEVTQNQSSTNRRMQPIRLQERDLDTLESLSVGRYLPVHAIEWLHYPGWRERYKAYLEQRKADPSKIFYPSPNLYHRLVAMHTNNAPLLHRVVRLAERCLMSTRNVTDDN
jgi:hypothetical protein